MSFFDNAKTITFAGKAVKKLELAGKTIWEAISFKNWVPYSIDADGSIFNGVGYKDGYRLSSSGGVSASAQTTVTGFIPAKPGDVIRIKGYRWYTQKTSTQYLIAYNSSFAKVYTGTSTRSYNSPDFIESMEYANGISTVKLKSGVNAYTYIRICTNDMNESNGAYNSHATGANLIVTVNQEIPQ